MNKILLNLLAGVVAISVAATEIPVAAPKSGSKASRAQEESKRLNRQRAEKVGGIIQRKGDGKAF